MTEEHKSLNNWLRESYGRTVTGKTKFRIVWSEDITEHRKGQFNEFYGKIFLRTIIGIRELPKYNYIHNRYILEGWKDEDLSFNGGYLKLKVEIISQFMFLKIEMEILFL